MKIKDAEEGKKGNKATIYCNGFSKSFVLARFRPSKDDQIKKTTETMLDPLGTLGSDWLGQNTPLT